MGCSCLTFREEHQARLFFSLSGDVRATSCASLWPRIFNIRVPVSEVAR
jgi:hypothetical protein